MIEMGPYFCDHGSPKEYLPRSGLLRERDTQLAGAEAYEIEREFGGFPLLEIALKRNGRIWTISYREASYDRRVNIKSPSDWKYKDTFDPMLSTFRFIPARFEYWPCK